MIAARFESGDDADVLAIEGEILTLISPRAFAPGAPLRFTCTDLTLAGKSLGSKRRDDGRFDVRLRLVNLRRTDRERLGELLPEP